MNKNDIFNLHFPIFSKKTKFKLPTNLILVFLQTQKLRKASTLLFLLRAIAIKYVWNKDEMHFHILSLARLIIIYMLPLQEGLQ